MEETLLDVVEECRNGNYAIDGGFEDSSGNYNKYYVVRGDEAHVRLWNSSNQESIRNVTDMFEQIADSLEDGDEEGQIFDGWNHLMWEVVNGN